MRKPLFLVPALLAGCATAAPPAADEPAAPVAGQSGSACRSGDYSAFKGRAATSEVRAELQRASGARTVRVVEPGMMVTMEYLEDRLTVRVDEQNRILSASCG